MNVVHSPEIEQLRKTLERFVTEEVLPLERQHELTWDRPPPSDLRRQVRQRAYELGLYGIDMPTDVGGGGLSFAGRCALEIDNHFHDTLFFEDVLGGGGGPTTILLAASEGQRRRYLEPLVRGEVTTCFALSEPEAGSDAGSLRMRAERKNGSFVLNGIKSIVSNGPQADFTITFAVTDPEKGPAGVTCFLVDRDQPGFRVSRSHRCMGFEGFQGEFTFENCEVSADSVLGEEGLGLKLALDWINGNRVRTAAMAAGNAKRLLTKSARFARERKQFGKPIADFQAIQVKLADMSTELFAAESMIYRTARMLDEGQDIRTEAAMTKLFCSEMVNRTAYEAIQIHGGPGCLLETGIERVYRAVRILTILEGTSEMLRLSVAKRALKDAASAAA